MAARPTNYGLSKALGSLGVKGGDFPALDAGAMVPTISMGSLGNNFAAEVFESRGFVGFRNASVAVDHCAGFLLRSAAAGGIVIESIHLELEDIGSAVNPSGYAEGGYLVNRFDIGVPPYASMGGKVVTSIGGPSPKTECEAIQIDVFTAGVDWQQMPSDWVIGALDIWIPPASTFIVLASLMSTNVITFPKSIFGVSFREIPEAQGAR